jgi:hypothetical protein
MSAQSAQSQRPGFVGRTSPSTITPVPYPRRGRDPSQTGIALVLRRSSVPLSPDTPPTPDRLGSAGGGTLPRRGRAARRDCRPGLRRRQLERLCRQGHPPSRSTRGHRSELRADSPVQPGWPRRLALPVPRGGVDARTLGLDGTQRFDLELDGPPRPRQPSTLHIEHRDGRRESVPLLVRIDTAIEAAYFTAGGILPYVLEQLLAQDAREA